MKKKSVKKKGKTIRIKYTAFRHETSGKFVSKKYAERHPSMVEEAEIAYTLKRK